MQSASQVIAFTSGGIGDQLYHFSQIQALSNYHNSPVDLVCRQHAMLASLCANSSWAGQILDADPLRSVTRPRSFLRAVRQIQGNKYRYAYILHRSTSFKLAAKLAGIKQITGLAGAGSDRWLVDKLLSADAGGDRRSAWGHRPFIAAIDAYLAERGLDFEGPPPIVPAADDTAAIQRLFADFPRPWIITNLFTQDINRCWPQTAAMQRLSDAQAQHGGTIFISSGEDARHWYQPFLQDWPKTHRAPVMLPDHHLSLAQTIALYHLADIYVGIDSFTANLALNCDLPALILFGKLADALSYRPHVVGLAPEQGKKLDSLSADLFAEKMSETFALSPSQTVHRITG